MTRRSALFIPLAAAGSLLVASACGNSGKDDKSETKNPAVSAESPAGNAGDDLEAAILAPGPKTVTAVSADGETQVIGMGKTQLAETDTYLVHAVVPADVAAGADGFVLIDLTPKPGWKINQEFPTKLKVTAPEGVTVTPESQGMGEAATFSEKAAQFKVAFQATTAGDKAFVANFRFAMCTDATCDPKSADLAWNQVVK